MKNRIFTNLKDLVLLSTLTVCSNSFAGVISYSGIGFDGGISTTTGIKHLSEYEFSLLENSHLNSNNNFNWFNGNQYKFEKDFTSIEMTTYTDGRGEKRLNLTRADYRAKQSLSFQDSEAADLFSDKLNNATFTSEITNTVLHRPRIINNASNILNFTVEELENQTRTTDSAFDAAMYSNEPYSRYAVDYSFNALLYPGIDFSLFNLLLNKSTTDFLKSSHQSLLDLSAFEQDLSFLTFSTEFNQPFMKTSYSQRFWFDNKASAVGALNYFENDIRNIIETTLNGPIMGSLHLQQSSLSLNQNIAEVPEPSTLLLFGLAIAVLLLRSRSY